MWMVGYNEGGGDQLNMVVDHSFSGRKLRPLMPRPMTSPNNYSSTTTTPCLSRSIHGHDFFSQYHHHHLLGEQNKRDNNQFNAPATPVVGSSRWNPTPEQLTALEELYRRGTRTPSAEQIQHITAQLRRFGKIEGKNVFYWFQNHKARERQKRRRQLESSAASDHHNHQHHQGHNNNNHRDYDALEKKELAASIRTVLEVEQTKNWAPSTNCSTLAEESVSIQRAAKAGDAECRPDGWLQFDEGELQQRRNFIERNAMWHMLQQSSCPAPAPVTHLINTLPNAAIMATTSTAVATSTTTTTMDPTKLIKNHDLSFFISTQRRKNGAISCENDDNCVESQTTLQLFPLRSGGDDDGSSDDNINDKETDISASAVNANNNLTPSQFFEFLPLKN